LIVGKAIFDGDVLALDESGLVQALPECTDKLSRAGRPRAAEEPDHRHRRLLRARRDRPRRRAADERDELPPSHSITSSARARRVSGTARPSALAVLRLMANSYLVGACTGSCAGFSPLRMRATYVAACRA